MIIHDKQQCYIHIPKCGGVSISRRFIAKYHKDKRNGYITIQNRNWQGNLLSGFQRKHKEKAWEGQFNNIHATYDQLALQYPDYKYFTVIRHPLTRWESLYKWLCDNLFIIDWDIITWTKKATSSIENGCFWGTVQDLDYFEKIQEKMGSMHVMYLPAWVFYREPEVEVHRLEDQTIWEALNIEPLVHHKSITQIPEYNRIEVKDLIYNYYRKDFERWNQ